MSGLWERYERGELPAIHCSKDALKIQADRILNNLQKHFTNMTKEEIRNIVFSDCRE